MSLKGKVAIVTGAGNGLGRSYALSLAKLGCKVVVNDPAKDSEGKYVADTVVKIIISNGGIAVASFDSVLVGEKIVECAVKIFGKVDILINNAGILRDKTFIKMSQTEWNQILDVHLNGVFKITKAVWKIMNDQSFGRIVNVSSGSGLYGNFGQTNYSTAKSAMIGFTKTLAIEGRSKNILVNCIAPLAASKMTANILPPTLLKKLEPKEVTPFVVMLCDPNLDSSVSGRIFELGGGFVAENKWIQSAGMRIKDGNIDTIFEKLGDFSKNATFPTKLTDILAKI